MLDVASPGGGSAAPVYCQDQELELNENEFCWGPKARVIQENNIVYHESFFFGGTEYSCYDSIYLYKEGEPEPYIAKILEVWEDRVENTNKMKVLWFFRPIEIPKWLEDESKPAYKEIFLASGEGKGVTNVINTLNVIVGKCEVLCTSVDKRNPQPSEEDLEATHYYFYRTFDVENYTISEDMDLIIKDFGVESIFNTQGLQKTNSATGLSEEHQTNEGERVHHMDTQSNRAPILDANKDIAMGDVLKEDFHDKSDAVILSNKEDVIVGDGIGANTGVDDMVTDWKETPKMDYVNEETKVYKRWKCTLNIVGSHDILNGVSVGAPLGGPKDIVGKESLGFETIPLSKVKFIDGSPRASEGKKLEELNIRHMTIEVSHTCQMIKENLQIEQAKPNENDTPKEESIEVENKSTKTPDLIVNLSEDSVKKMDDLVKKVEASGKKMNKSKKEDTNSEKVPDKKPSPSSSKASKKSTSLLLQPDSAKNDKEPFKVTQNKKYGRGLIKQKLDSIKETSNSKKEFLNSEHMSIKSKLGDDSSKAFEDLIFMSLEDTGVKKENIYAHKIIEVTKRPELESNKCLKEHPWDEHLQSGYEQGSVILLENVDPSYTSTEVEDIIWNVFAEHCAAKVIPQTAVSIPRMGQALLVFKTKQGAEVTLKKLEEGCLMLSNERPLIATKANPVHSTKSIKFAGHFSVKKHKLQMQPICQSEDMIKAVAPPHCSQPHTIEYEMAMEWALMQEKSDRWWTELYKKQEEEVELLKQKLCILNPEKYPGN